MADDESDEDEEEGPAVELGEGERVEGAPLARVAARLHYGIARSDVVRREGDTLVRTAEGPRELRDLLEASDETFFPTRQDLVDAVQDVVDTAPVPTE